MTLYIRIELLLLPSHISIFHHSFFSVISNYPFSSQQHSQSHNFIFSSSLILLVCFKITCSTSYQKSRFALSSFFSLVLFSQISFHHLPLSALMLLSYHYLKPSLLSFLLFSSFIFSSFSSRFFCWLSISLPISFSVDSYLTNSLSFFFQTTVAN